MQSIYLGKYINHHIAEEKSEIERLITKEGNIKGRKISKDIIELGQNEISV